MTLKKKSVAVTITTYRGHSLLETSEGILHFYSSSNSEISIPSICSGSLPQGIFFLIGSPL